MLMLLLALVEPVGAGAASPLRLADCCTASPIAMGPAGFVAVIAGWVTTEVGRQPFTVLWPAAHRRFGLAARRRRRSATSLLAFIVVYFIVFGAGIFYILRLMSHAPHRGEEGPERAPAGARRRHHAGAAQVAPKEAN